MHMTRTPPAPPPMLVLLLSWELLGAPAWSSFKDYTHDSYSFVSVLCNYCHYRALPSISNTFGASQKKKTIIIYVT